MAAVALVSAVTISGCSDDDEIAGTELTARDFSFQPAELVVTGGKQVTITVVNRGKVAHNLSIPSVEIDVDVDKGEDGRVIFVLPEEPGNVEFSCKFHAGQGMKGTFRVLA